MFPAMAMVLVAGGNALPTSQQDVCCGLCKVTLETIEPIDEVTPALKIEQVHLKNIR